MSGGAQPATSGDDMELVLQREEVTLVKRVVPYERVRVHKEVVTYSFTVNDAVRSEHIDVDRP